MQTTKVCSVWRLPAILLLTLVLIVGESQMRSIDAQPAPPRMADEQYTPVIQSVLSLPRWFKVADDHFHLTYELLLTNTIPVPVTVTSVEVRDAGRGTAVATLRDEALTAAMSLLASPDTSTTALPPSTVGVVWFDLPFADRSAIPAAVEHQVTIGLPPGLPVPESITDIGGRPTSTFARRSCSARRCSGRAGWRRGAAATVRIAAHSRRSTAVCTSASGSRSTSIDSTPRDGSRPTP